MKHTFSSSLIILIFCCYVSVSLAKPYDSEDDGMIHLHVVPHTHNDAGWLYTVDSYFKGDNDRGCVECILNSITDALQVNPDRRFVYVEQVFFQSWWNEIPNYKREIVLDLIQRGQLDFLLAGYVMNDEACSYYDDIIEQMTLGHRFVKSTFNRTVNVGWHIDPFGHSAAQARLFSEMGFDSWFFERIDYQDFNNRLSNGSLEMIWRPNSYDPNSIFLMAHVNYMSYYLAPYNWCIDMLCYPEPSIPETVRRTLRYVNWVKNQTKFFTTKHILHHVGGDFEWSGNAEMHFEGLETIIDFINSHPELGIKAYFSTPSNYTTSVYNEIRKKNIKLTEKTDDFFPYQDVPNGYWSGYFTSKSSQKLKVKEGSKFLQTSKKLLAKLILDKKINFYAADEMILHLERAISILQHHDAVTGTAKHNVDMNYTAILNNAVNGVLNLIVPKVQDWYNGIYGGIARGFDVCEANSTNCPTITNALTTGQPLALVVFNPSQHTEKQIKVPVPNLNLKVYDNSGSEVPSDIFCDIDDISAEPVITIIDVSSILNSNTAMSNCQLFFLAEADTNTLTSFTIKQGNTIEDRMADETLDLNQNHLVELFNNEKLMIEAVTGSFTYKKANGLSHTFRIDYRYYPSYDTVGQQASGAYIFRSKTRESLAYSAIEQVSVKKGNLLIEVSVKRGLVLTKIRFYKNYISDAIEIETFLKPVPIMDRIGKEITLNIETSDINNNGTFYTDANGLEMQKRVVDFRPTYNVEVLEHAAGNYYPINSAIYIEDQNSGQRMTVMNDRSQGGASLKDGSLEIMIHRRVLYDDNRGVEEPLNEVDDDGVGITLLMTHYLVFSKGPESQRSLQYGIDTPPQIFVSQIASVPPILNAFANHKSLKASVNEVKLYIRPYSANELLVRLHNIHENHNITVPFLNTQDRTCETIREIFGSRYTEVKVYSIEEVTLDTVQRREDVLKKKFNWDGNYAYQPIQETFENILLRPLEERVFMLTLSPLRAE